MAGPDQSEDTPLGIDGMKLHRWHLEGPKDEVDDAFTERLLGPRGAYIMGRNMFGPFATSGATPIGAAGGVPSPRTTPPCSYSPITRTTRSRWRAGRTFHFVDGFDSALAAAAKQAGSRPIDVAGGPSAVRQALQAGCLDELALDIIPVVLGRGERIFDDVHELNAEPVEVATSPLATHIVYRTS